MHGNREKLRATRWRTGALLARIAACVLLPLVAVLLPLAAGAPATAGGLTEVAVEPVATGLDRPVYATAPPGDARLFVVERPGRIRILEGGAVLATPFLDIRDRVGTAGEGGLLGLAFDPGYASNGRFFVYYTDTAGDSVLSRFAVGPDPDLADPAETVILVIDQPQGNHNGGTIAFGPGGFLHLGLGDGGGSYDPSENAQDPQSLLGKMLRLDVRVPPASDSLPVPGAAYAIPADNPFVGDPSTRDEIWALGLRNPYRFSFDRGTGDLWIADVGQSAREEIDLEPAGDPGGRNYGWDVEEGSLCVSTDPAPAPPCGDPSLTPPVHEYGHTDGNCSVTGGFVHRGSAPAVRGDYLFGDFCTSRVWSLDPATLQVTERTAELAPATDEPFELVGFGEDAEGETYLILLGGDVWRVVPAPAECGNGEDDDGDGLVDADDPGCMSADWPEEDPRCDNGRDDDGDGWVDTDDPDCTEAWRLSESPARGCRAGGSAALAIGLAAWAVGSRDGGRRRAAPRKPPAAAPR